MCGIPNGLVECKPKDGTEAVAGAETRRTSRPVRLREQMG
jgi:hypothetical protein